MSITIRRAIKEDCTRLMELIQELANYEKAPDDVTVTKDHFEQSGFGDHPVWWAFVAISHNDPLKDEEAKQETERQGIIVGFALYYVRYSTWKGQAMYLEDIIVTESMRGKKIGKLLFDRLIEEAREKKWNRIIWQVLDWNEPAINFYKKYNAGFDSDWVNCSLYV